MTRAGEAFKSSQGKARDRREASGSTRRARRGTAGSTRVVLVDDHAEARAGMRIVLSAKRDLEIVGEAGTGQDALALCRESHPDLVLVDLRLPDMSGLSVMRSIKRESPNAHVILITLDAGPSVLAEALRSGADAYVLKGTPRDELLAIIRDVLRGAGPIHSRLAGWLLDIIEVTARTEGGRASSVFTAMEVNVLRLRAKGRSNAAIARALAIGTTDVAACLDGIVERLSHLFG